MGKNVHAIASVVGHGGAPLIGAWLPAARATALHKWRLYTDRRAPCKAFDGEGGTRTRTPRGT